MSEPPERPSSAPAGRIHLGPAEAAIFETFVVPRYLSHFGELALEMMVESEDAQVVHLQCRTGYPDRGIATRLRGAYVVGIDESQAAIELARAKAATMPELVSHYLRFESFPSTLPGSAFSHALVLCPLARQPERQRVIQEAARLLAAHGQVLVAMPVRGSFQEIADLLREYSLKHDDFAVGRAVEQAALARPSVETLGSELMEAGFDFVEDMFRPTMLRFRSGRDFFEDPVARLVILPEVRAELGIENPEAALAYVREAIDKYWSGSEFDLTMNVACVTARREPPA